MWYARKKYVTNTYSYRYHFLLQVRILDLYFVEGYKVFYRVGFALLRYFVKYIKKSNGIISSRGIKGAFMYFCKEITVRLSYVIAFNNYLVQCRMY